jgi:hypothetical protein
MWIVPNTKAAPVLTGFASVSKALPSFEDIRSGTNKPMVSTLPSAAMTTVAPPMATGTRSPILPGQTAFIQNSMAQQCAAAMAKQQPFIAKPMFVPMS